jgi:peptidoglycan hydrolase CwlO-like protein
MSKSKMFFLTFLCLLLTPLFVYFNTQRVYGEEYSKVQENLNTISEEEKAVLQDLFFLTQEIEEMERQEVEITGEIKGLEADIKALEAKIKEQQDDYDSQLLVMKKVFVSYQKLGPASYLETLLSAKDFTTFLKSINIIRNLSDNVSDLLETIEAGKDKLVVEKETLSIHIEKLEEKKVALKEPLLRKKQLKAEQEAYLSSLEDNKAYYEEQLNNLDQMWKEIKILFSQIVDEFKTIINAGSFTNDDLNLQLSFTKITGFIDEDTLNRILEDNSKLPKMVFNFNSDNVVIEIPEKHLVLLGNFIIEENSMINFQVEEGTFYNIPLEKTSIEELFRDGSIYIDFEEVAGDMLLFDIQLESVRVNEKSLEFELSPDF